MRSCVMGENPSVLSQNTCANAKQLGLNTEISLHDCSVSEFLARDKGIVDSLASVGDPVS